MQWANHQKVAAVLLVCWLHTYATIMRQLSPGICSVDEAEFHRPHLLENCIHLECLGSNVISPSCLAENACAGSQNSYWQAIPTGSISTSIKCVNIQRSTLLNNSGSHCAFEHNTKCHQCDAALTTLPGRNDTVSGSNYNKDSNWNVGRIITQWTPHNSGNIGSDTRVQGLLLDSDKSSNDYRVRKAQESERDIGVRAFVKGVLRCGHSHCAMCAFNRVCDPYRIDLTRIPPLAANRRRNTRKMDR